MAIQQMLLGGDQVNVEDVFRTKLYTGTGQSQDIDNGINLAADGGLVWIKSRDGTQRPYLFDTERGATNLLSTMDKQPENWVNPDQDETTTAHQQTLTAFNNNGFTVGTRQEVNDLNRNYVAWTWRKQEKFFDIVEYSGNGNHTQGQTISHNLGSVPGMIILIPKNHNDQNSYRWVYHRSRAHNEYAFFTNDGQSGTHTWLGGVPTASNFNVVSTEVNTNNIDYVAYLFAHNETIGGSGPLIYCSQYSGGGTTATTVNLGFEPQFVIVKAFFSNRSWFLFDSERGNEFLHADNANMYSHSSAMTFNSNGFTVDDVSTNSNGVSYIYMAVSA
jgi:hypothetical protein